MGCGTSGDPQSRKVYPFYSAKEKLSAEEGADLLDTYLRLERDIWKEERAPPAPALGHGMVRLGRLTAALEAAESDVIVDMEEHDLMPGSLPDFAAIFSKYTSSVVCLHAVAAVRSALELKACQELHCPSTSSIIAQDIRSVSKGRLLTAYSTVNKTSKGENEDEAIKRVVNVLGLNKKPDLAAEHEEFIATLNRKAMRQTRSRWLARRKAEAQEEVDRLTERVQHLQALYEHQDSLLQRLEGEGRSDDAGELDRLRTYRDTLYGGELNWREAARLVEAAGALARVAASDWDQAKDTTNGDARWRLGVETRTGVQEATLCIQAAQIALSSVPFPYCTHREMTAILQVLEYIFTDLQIPERYNHASQVYSSFYKRASALHVWLKKMIENEVHKNVLEVDQRFAALASKVTNQRVNSIRQLAGLGMMKTYSRGGGLKSRTGLRVTDHLSELEGLPAEVLPYR